MSNILIYDPAYSGHHLEYILHLINFIKSHQEEGIQYIFNVHSKLRGELDKHWQENIIYIYLEEKDNSSLSLEFSRLDKYISKYNCDQILFLQIDNYLESWKGISQLKRLQTKVKGIVFRPYTRIKSNSFFSKKNIKKKYKKLLLQYFLCFRNEKLLFVLNDKKSTHVFSKLFFGDTNFEYLPDPINKKANIPDTEEIDFHQNNLLIFGSVDARKNVANILKGIQLLDNELQETIKLQIIGKVKDYYEKEFFDLIENFRAINSLVEIEIRNEFVSEETLDKFFIKSDIILIPYVNFYSSSGVLGHSAGFKKPVLASNYGLLGDLVESYQIGKTVDPENPIDIANKLELFLNNKNQFKGNYEGYLLDKAPNNFAEILLKES